MVCAPPGFAAAQGTAHLIRDIFPGADPTAFSDPQDFVELSGLVVFTADDGVHGRELWRTDGTEAGTLLVKDVDFGRAGSAFYSFGPLTKSGGHVFFVAYDDIHGSEPWRSDGTADGTVMLRDINPGPEGSGPGFVFAEAGTVYFWATDGSTGIELWKSDGTESGTVRVADINPGAGSSYPYGLTRVNDALLFVANDGVHGCELWHTDGTEAGTWLVKDTYQTDECQVELFPWPNPPPSKAIVSVTPQWLTGVDGMLFFTTADRFGSSLWTSDGTEAGTVPIARFGGCAGFEVFSCPPSCLTNVNGTLYFQAEIGGTGREPWRSDGTEAGTMMLKNVNPNECFIDSTGFDPCSSDACGFRPVNGEVIFTAKGGDLEDRLWMTDGTPEGTRPAPPGPTPTPGRRIEAPGGSAMLNGILIFGNRELYRSDGTEAGTVLLKDINTRPASSFPKALTDVDGTLYFFANDSNGFGELWRSDGTADGTSLVKNVNPSAQYTSSRRALTRVGDRLMFIADDDAHGTELWRSDGTVEGTVVVKDIFPGPYGGFLPDYSAFRGPELIAVGESVFFAAQDGNSGIELWRSDGTEAGTTMVKDINPGPDGSIFGGLVEVNGTLFFAALDGAAYFRQLWKSDGTPAGTVKVADATQVPGEPNALTNLNGTLFFVGPDAGGWALWKSDGTAAGTDPLKRGFRNSPPNSLINVNGALFFVAPSDGNDLALWRSDGTEAGTRVVKDIHLSPAQGGFSSQAVTHDTLFFSFFSEGVGDELWKSDGTEPGTGLVKDINPGPASSLPRLLTSVGGRLLFFAEDGTTGPRLWTSDGTAAGTLAVQEVPDYVSVNTYVMPAVAGSEVYFAADDTVTGTELWALPVSALPPACAGDCDGSCTVTIDELIRGVNITLGTLALDSCAILDANHDGTVTVDELLPAVERALGGCL